VSTHVAGIGVVRLLGNISKAYQVASVPAMKIVPRAETLPIESHADCPRGPENPLGAGADADESGYCTVIFTGDFITCPQLSQAWTTVL
jgi:hypothetical protein